MKQTGNNNAAGGGNIRPDGTQDNATQYTAESLEGTNYFGLHSVVSGTVPSKYLSVLNGNTAYFGLTDAPLANTPGSQLFFTPLSQFNVKIKSDNESEPVQAIYTLDDTEYDGPVAMSSLAQVRTLSVASSTLISGYEYNGNVYATVEALTEALCQSDPFEVTVIANLIEKKQPIMVNNTNQDECLTDGKVIALRWVTNAYGDDSPAYFNGTGKLSESRMAKVDGMETPQWTVLYQLVKAETSGDNTYFYLKSVSNGKYVGRSGTAIQMIDESTGAVKFEIIAPESLGGTYSLSSGYLLDNHNIYCFKVKGESKCLKAAGIYSGDPSANYGDYSASPTNWLIWGIFDMSPVVVQLGKKGALDNGEQVYNTYANTNPYNVQVYNATANYAEVDDTKVKLNNVDENIVNAGCGVVLSGNVGDYVYYQPTSANSSTTDTGLSVATGSFESTGDYVLAYPKTGTDARFYVTNGLTMKVGQVYLAGSALTNNIQSLRIVAGDNVDTGIADMQDEPSCDAVYNLGGQRVNNPSSGIYIMGGKKVVIK